MNFEMALHLYFARKMLRYTNISRCCWNRRELLRTPKIAQKLPNTIGTGSRSSFCKIPETLIFSLTLGNLN